MAAVTGRIGAFACNVEMPWTVQRYPSAMRRLPPALRDKAIEIANAMLADGCEEGQAIRVAIATAKKWAARRWMWNAAPMMRNASPRRSGFAIRPPERQ